eukprot:CAMPEP_0179050084 /NCGR_PEP_ID=MMETSP0796-20121207/20544_1 /TAXON_ID=73915 /ORGANISM="Pyrodinium bahamense, Strain pbaha01" /LENGTH=121 /DNA_ID=CAMNT_0020746577 /DNA_START=1422 /DNA_END=1787 /DNA_ORIENTATION=-
MFSAQLVFAHGSADMLCINIQYNEAAMVRQQAPALPVQLRNPEDLLRGPDDRHIVADPSGNPLEVAFLWVLVPIKGPKATITSQDRAKIFCLGFSAQALGLHFRLLKADNCWVAEAPPVIT